MATKYITKSIQNILSELEDFVVQIVEQVSDKDNESIRAARQGFEEHKGELLKLLSANMSSHKTESVKIVKDINATKRCSKKKSSLKKRDSPIKNNEQDILPVGCICPLTTPKMGKVELFDNIIVNLKEYMTPENFVYLRTTKGKTQSSEKKSLACVRNILDNMRAVYDVAGSQQSKDFRNINDTGLNIEVKKTDTKRVIFNDTCPNKDIYYIIFFTGKENTRTIIPPCILGLNGAVFIKNSDWIQEYKREINVIKDKYCHGEAKKSLSGIMAVYVRPTYSADISEFLEVLKK